MTNTENDSSPLWEYVFPGDYKVPSDSVEQTVQNRLVDFWNRLRPESSKPDESPYMAEDELEHVSAAFLDRAVSAPDWQAAVPTLDHALSGVNRDKYGNSAIVLLGQPHDGRVEILTCWANQQGWRIIEPPTPHEILTENDSWLTQLEEDETPWVLPRLEKCYLRHARGLTILRVLFGELGTKRLGQGVIGCDSWAWAYLQHVLPGASPITFMAQAFDHERLSRWLRSLAAPHFTFRQADDGQYVLPSATENDAEAESGSVSRSLLRHLAARSRGIPMVAWTLWRTSLRAEAEAEVEAEVESNSASSQETTVWVLPASQFRKLSLPNRAGQETAFVLHTLLLHDGLPAGLLPQLLPLTNAQIDQQLASLEAADVLETVDDQWRVTALGYLPARQFLDDGGYLMDS